MIRKSGNRFSETIILKQEAGAGCRSNDNSSRPSHRRHSELAPILAALALQALPGCSTLGDLGYVQAPAVADNIHAWVGQEAVSHAGLPISLANLTEDERTRLELIPDISPPERFNALARVAENNLTIAWVQESLAQRCASYRFALNRLAVSEPEDMATNVDISLTLMQQQIASNQLVQPGPFRAVPVAVAAKPPPIVK